MKHKFNKIILAGIVGLSLFGLSSVIGEPKLAAAGGANIRYITTNVGENENEVGINFHSNVEHNVVEYATNKSFANSTTIDATSHSFEQDMQNKQPETVWSKRFVCQARLSGLKENTKYYYRVKAKDSTEASEVHSFTTHSKDNTSAKIFWGTDIHTSAGYAINSTNAQQNTQNVLNQNKGVNLIVDTGDYVDRGGYESNWERYYSDMKVNDDLMVAKIPGNHEYYHTSDGGYINPSFYNLFNANPENGPEARRNSTYYFKYGNILFVMLDTIDKKFAGTQKAWFKEVVANNPSQWIIVGTHAGFYSCGAYAGDCRWMRENWQSTFEECQVDLVLSGHEHVYIRKDLEYKKNKDENLGVTYFVSPALGTKSYKREDVAGAITKQAVGCGSVLIVDENGLTVKTYERNLKNGKMDELKDLTFTLKPKRPVKTTSLSDQEILDSIHIDYDEVKETARIVWNENLYGNVKNIDITKKFDNIVDERHITISSPKLNFKQFDNIFNDEKYTFELVLHKADGSTLTKTLRLPDYTESAINTELNGGTVKGMAKTYIEGKEYILPVPTKENAVFKGWYLTSDFTGDPIDRISASQKGEVNIYAKWANINSIEYELNGGTLDNPVNSYTEGETVKLPTPTNGKSNFLGWYLTPDCSGESITEINASMTGNIKLYAKWKKGCSCKKTNLVIELLSATALLAVVLRKKH